MLILYSHRYAVLDLTALDLELNICFTDPEYMRRGAGSMMLEWGCKLADHLSYDAWIEASPSGNQLYKHFGFGDVSIIEEGGLSGTTMKRDRRMDPIVGGKP